MGSRRGRAASWRPPRSSLLLAFGREADAPPQHGEQRGPVSVGGSCLRRPRALTRDSSVSPPSPAEQRLGPPGAARPAGGPRRRGRPSRVLTGTRPRAGPVLLGHVGSAVHLTTGSLGSGSGFVSKRPTASRWRDRFGHDLAPRPVACAAPRLPLRPGHSLCSRRLSLSHFVILSTFQAF